MKKIPVIYWSGTGNTQAMAESIAAGLAEAGAEAEVIEVSSADASALAECEKIAFGCPATGSEELEEYEFEPFFTAVESSLAGKKVALFGSYSWGDGQWMRDWIERTESAGANILDEGLIAQDTPDLAECVEYGKKFAAF
ncbi:MAG: flavodoxin [Christensenellales bacterium]|jgi:flavodoxin I